MSDNTHQRCRSIVGPTQQPEHLSTCIEQVTVPQQTGRQHTKKKRKGKQAHSYLRWRPLRPAPLALLPPPELAVVAAATATSTLSPSVRMLRAGPSVPLKTLPFPLGEQAPRLLAPSAADETALVSFRADPLPSPPSLVVSCASMGSGSAFGSATSSFSSPSLRHLPHGGIADSDSPRILLSPPEAGGALLVFFFFLPSSGRTATARRSKASSFASRWLMSCEFFGEKVDRAATRSKYGSDETSPQRAAKWGV